MARFEIKMPKLGESITEGTILSWSVQVGDVVNEDDVLFEVNTAKVSAEIPSPVAGKVVEILLKYKFCPQLNLISKHRSILIQLP